MTVHDFHHDEAVYALAIEKADYRRAAWIAVRALRRERWSSLWRLRLCGSLKLRHS